MLTNSEQYLKITIKSYTTNLILVTLQPDDLPDL